MLYSFIIRQAAEEDAESIYSILQDAFKEYRLITGVDKLDALSETADEIRKDIKNKMVYVAVIDDKIVGTLRLEIKDNEAYLSRFAVDPESRNIGIGKSLMSVVDKYLKEKGVSKVTLHTASRHGELMRFYYGQGFYVEAIETDRGYLRARLVKEIS